MSLLSSYHLEFAKDYLQFKNSSKTLSQPTIVQRLLRLPQPEQRTQAWYDLRREMITASSAATLIPKTKKYMKEYLLEYNLLADFKEEPEKGCNPYSSKNEFYLDKCGHRTFEGNEATLWGQKYEDVVQAIYARHINEHIYNFGLIPHPTLNYLGASPDGISESGIMLEIKVPFRRKITGIPPIYYWVQVQLQLEVCNLERCDFVECKISEYKNEADWLSDKTAEQKGLILNIGMDKYLYPPVTMTDPRDLNNWAEEYIRSNPENSRGISKAYWRLDQINITRINRSREWFKRIRPLFYNSHLELKWHQKDKAETLLKRKEESEKKRKSMDLRPYMLAATKATSLVPDGGFTDSESEDSESETEMSC